MTKLLEAYYNAMHAAFEDGAVDFPPFELWVKIEIELELEALRRTR